MSPGCVNRQLFATVKCLPTLQDDNMIICQYCDNSVLCCPLVATKCRFKVLRNKRKFKHPEMDNWAPSTGEDHVMWLKAPEKHLKMSIEVSMFGQQQSPKLRMNFSPMTFERVTEILYCRLIAGLFNTVLWLWLLCFSYYLLTVLTWR